MSFELSELFVAVDARPEDDELRVELEALTSGTRRLWFCGHRRSLRHETSEAYDRIEKEAFDRELPMSLIRDLEKSGGALEIFDAIYLHQLEESWRIEAIEAYRTAAREHDRSDALQHVQGVLFGHSAERIADDLRDENERLANSLSPTVIFLVDDGLFGSLRRLGFRAFPGDTDVAALGPHIPGRRLRLKRDFLAHLPAQVSVGRLALAKGCDEILNGPERAGDAEIWAGAFDCDVSTLNNALASPIQILGEDGWS